jgi:hypothetical protein
MGQLLLTSIVNATSKQKVPTLFFATIYSFSHLLETSALQFQMNFIHRATHLLFHLSFTFSH